MAGELDVDLVEIAATANPPVCRLMDYGKFKYQEQKKAAEAKAKQTVIEIKEVKFRPGTDDGDYNIKMRNIRRFLAEGDKCKITLRFRGREITHQEIGMALLQPHSRRAGRPDHRRAVPQAGRPADDHDDRAGQEEGGAAKPAASRQPPHSGFGVSDQQAVLQGLVAAGTLTECRRCGTRQQVARGHTRRGTYPRRLTSTN